MLWLMHIVFCVTVFLTFHSKYYHIYSPTFLSIVIWLVPGFLLLWIVLWTFFCMSLLNMCKNVLSIYVGGEMAILFPKWLRHLILPPETRDTVSSRPSSTLDNQLTFLSLSLLPSFILCQSHRFKTAPQSGLDLHDTEPFFISRCLFH